ncbi:ras GTPase-activating protein-binding protein 1-like [Canna indica]|uniref:Ras GTPase-activating protein-binding protein 1-like n=1 Tax=Canna indica TaxID=4628 RepID=A0AAQ3Q7X0_9LILI|nr:ras GTPase-activating protein-binding protein 1-like [Canna indica]
MATHPSSDDSSPPPAQVVGNAFVQQYYHILQQSPELVHRFYQDGSKMGRPDANGAMNEITTADAINENILSRVFVRAELKTVDAQESLGGGVTVLVMGYLTGEDNVRKDFIQSFFLAPQQQGYYVLNDIFRFVEEVEHQQEYQGLVNGTDAPHALEHDLPLVQEHYVSEQTVPLKVDEEVHDGEVCNPSSDKGEDDEESPGEIIDDKVPNSSQGMVIEPDVITVQEDMPKLSYASIVKASKDNGSASVTVRTLPRPVPTKRDSEALPTPAALPAPTATQASDIPAASLTDAKSSNVQETETGYSIYVKNLPYDATPAQLEEEFKKHGSIKTNGIQVRGSKMQGFCFGFVEFEEASAVQSAIEASPIKIGGRQVFVEQKRTTGPPVANRGGRFAQGRGGFRNDGRGRGNYSGGRGYARGYFNNRSDFGGNRGA